MEAMWPASLLSSLPFLPACFHVFPTMVDCPHGILSQKNPFLHLVALHDILSKQPKSNEYTIELVLPTSVYSLLEHLLQISMLDYDCAFLVFMLW